MSLFYIFKINCIFILITFYFKILLYCTSNFVPICILESYRVLSVCITWYSFKFFFMLRNNFDHLYDFCVCHEDALIYNITPTHQYILFCVTSWMVHWSLALGFHTDLIIIKKNPDDWWLFEGRFSTLTRKSHEIHASFVIMSITSCWPPNSTILVWETIQAHLSFLYSQAGWSLGSSSVSFHQILGSLTLYCN